MQFVCSRTGKRMYWLPRILPPKDWISRRSLMSSTMIFPRKSRITVSGHWKREREVTGEQFYHHADTILCSFNHCWGRGNDPVHRIGRTGRSGKTGLATTFVNMNSSEPTLLDLKHLLREAKQSVPPFLESLHDPSEIQGEGGAMMVGCTFCGGLGHRITDCPKFEAQRRQQMGSMLGGSRGGGEGGY